MEATSLLLIVLGILALLGAAAASAGADTRDGLDRRGIDLVGRHLLGGAGNAHARYQ